MNNITKSTVYLEFSNGNTMEIEGAVGSFEFVLDNKLGIDNYFISEPRAASCSLTFDMTQNEADAFRILLNTKPNWYKRFFNYVRNKYNELR